MTKILESPFFSALIGGALVAVVVAVTGAADGRRTVTVVQQAPLASSNSELRIAGLTPRQIYERDAPGVVFVQAQIVQRTQSPFDLTPQVQQGVATGSGFVIDRAGNILTNSHVIEGAVKVSVKLEDKTVVDAKVVGNDPSTDIALLKISPDGLNLHPLVLGSSKGIHVGDPTIAIGNPFGLDRTLTTGVVSALQRQITAPNGFGIQNVIQTDAALNPGNSGGPLLDSSGQVIGINSQIETGGGGGVAGASGNVGIGFAVPIDTAKQVVPQIKHGGQVAHAYLGLTTQTIDGSLATLKLPSSSGALVQSVQSGAPAARAGIRGGDTTAQVGGSQVQLGGDILVRADGKPITGSDDLAVVIGSKRPGDRITIELIRAGKHLTVTATLATRPRSVPTPTAPGR